MVVDAVCTGFEGGEIDNVFDLERDGAPAPPDMPELSDVYECERERVPIGTERCNAESEAFAAGPGGGAAGVAGGVSGGHSASGPGIGKPRTAATSCASVQSSSWSGKPFQNGDSFRSSFLGMYQPQHRIEYQVR